MDRSATHGGQSIFGWKSFGMRTFIKELSPYGKTRTCVCISFDVSEKVRILLPCASNRLPNLFRRSSIKSTGQVLWIETGSSASIVSGFYSVQRMIASSLVSFAFSYCSVLYLSPLLSACERIAWRPLTKYRGNSLPYGLCPPPSISASQTQASGPRWM